MLDEGHSINKLQSGFFLVISKYENVKYVFCWLAVSWTMMMSLWPIYKHR